MIETNNIRELLCKAIEESKVIEFTRFVKDENELKECVGNPHIIYRETTDNILVDIWVTGGYSKTGNLPDWRRYLLDDIKNVVIREEQFVLENTFKLNSERYAETYCKPKYKNKPLTLG